MCQNWFGGFLRENIFILEYEELVSNTEEDMRKVLHFLGTDLDDEGLKESSLLCALNRKTGRHKRPKMRYPQDIFGEAMDKRINDVKLRVYKYLGLHS